MADALRNVIIACWCKRCRQGTGEYVSPALQPATFRRGGVAPVRFAEERQQCGRQLSEAGCPFVLIEEQVKGPHAASIRADNRQGAEKAVAYLREKGHKRIAFLNTERSWPAFEERLAGYQAALKAHGCRAARMADRKRKRRHARQFVESALRERRISPRWSAPTTSWPSVPCRQPAGSARKVPEDIAIVGFDDFDFARYVDPPLTTVALPGYEMGHRAAELLFEYLAKGRFPRRKRSFPPRWFRAGRATVQASRRLQPACFVRAKPRAELIAEDES